MTNGYLSQYINPRVPNSIYAYTLKYIWFVNEYFVGNKFNETELMISSIATLLL